MFKLRMGTIIIICIGLLSGSTVALISQHVPSGSAFNIVLLNIGCGLIAAAFISVVLDIFYTKERVKAEREEIQPFLEEFKAFTGQLAKLEGRLEAFKQLGLNYCHASRKEALTRFLGYARAMIGVLPAEKTKDLDCVSCRGTINIVSSSSRGLMGYLDRQAHKIQKEWRDLITAYPKSFKILLTHPAYAHLRQPAEERSSGDIELEILKTAIYLHCVAGMGIEELRFYRGSPSVFLMRVEKHILLNPYPYGKMAMDTLCLEFESEHETSYVADFASMHFDHTWAFIHQNSKLVDGKMLVEGIGSFDHILKAFAECTFLNQEKRLRLTQSQIEELDTFTCATLSKENVIFINPPPQDNPFSKYINDNTFTCCDYAPVPIGS